MKLFFYVVYKTGVVSVVSDEIIPYLVLKSSVVSVVTNEIIFHVVMNTSVVSAVMIYDKTSSDVVSKTCVASAVSDAINSHLLLKTK